jgi:hypothetical protein
MNLTAITSDDLPFNKAGTVACAAARAGEVAMQLPGVPGEFRVQFIGTGVATMPDATHKVFAVSDVQNSVDMEWYQNKFVGRHWLLGDLKVELVPDRASTGSIRRDDRGVLFGSNTVNTNDFFFDFQFKRFPFLNMRNITPIRNSAVVSAVPPIGSVFRLEQPPNGAFDFRSGANRIADRENAPRKVVKFNQCDVVVFPEQNVGLTLTQQNKTANDTYSVTVEIENTTDSDATFAYFSVIHFAGIEVSDDYGFVLLPPGGKTSIVYNVLSRLSNRTVELPFFAALYRPTKLNGSKSLPLVFAF